MPPHRHLLNILFYIYPAVITGTAGGIIYRYNCYFKGSKTMLEAEGERNRIREEGLLRRLEGLGRMSKEEEQYLLEGQKTDHPEPR